MSSKIIEKILEPNKIYVGSNFVLKVKVEDDILASKVLATEDNRKILTEDNKKIQMEWGKENNG